MRMIEKTTNIQVGPGLVGSLTILFVLLKAFGLITWSWWWVFSPLWIAGLLILVVAFIVALLK